MTSVALLTKQAGGPILRDQWTKKELKIAFRAACHCLEGVGIESTDDLSDGELTTIIRRQCTDDERRLVGDEPHLILPG